MPKAKDFSLSGRTFGVELETVGVSRGAIMRALNAAEIPCVMAGYGSHDRMDNVWRVEPDGSLHSSSGESCEVVSPILRGQAGLDTLKRVCDVLRGVGAIVNRSCGLHVHMYAGDLQLEQLKRVCKQWIRDEQFVDLIMPTSRRASNNSYCASNMQSGRSVKEMFRLIDACTSAYALRQLMGGNRYKKLNLEAINEHETIEFRQHAGTLDYRKIANWIIFLDCFIDGAAKKAFVRLYSSDVCDKPLAEQVLGVAVVAGCPADTRNYFVARAMRLAGQSVRSRRLRNVDTSEEG